jgi:cytochrome o ubiquinol oxidase operon protein cyoD
MSHALQDPLQHPEVQVASGCAYLVASFVALDAMFLSLWLVSGQVLTSTELIVAISLIALVTAGIQFYLLFHLNFSESQFWHTVALVMTVPLFVMAIGLTIWMFHSLMARTMLPAAGM